MSFEGMVVVIIRVSEEEHAGPTVIHAMRLSPACPLLVWEIEVENEFTAGAAKRQ
jgi:hypothetical protein